MSGLTQPIQESEIAETIKSLWPGKSLGSESLTTSFYKHFHDELCPILTVVFNEVYHLGKLSLTQYLAIIVLLYKKGSKHRSENYHPISLTNTDYKILVYVLTHHLEDHLFALISLHQTAYMKGWFIGTNICSVQDMIDHIIETNGDELVLFLNFQKVFDSVSHQFLFQLLEHIGLPSEFVFLIWIIYADTFSVVRYKNWLTKGFFLGCGVRQGCPLSCYLFNLVGQVLVYSLHDAGFFGWW